MTVVPINCQAQCAEQIQVAIYDVIVVMTFPYAIPLSAIPETPSL